MKELPCKQLKCELLERLSKGLRPTDFSMTIEEMTEVVRELCDWFNSRGISPVDAIGIVEVLKADYWEVIARTN